MTKLLGAEHVEALQGEIKNSVTKLADSVDNLNRSTTVLYWVMIVITGTIAVLKIIEISIK